MTKDEKIKEIARDLRQSLAFAEHNGVYLSMLNHLEVECNDTEINMVHIKTFDLPDTKYDSYKEFVDDYQEIWDIVEFPILACVNHYDSLAFSLEKLDKYIKK